MTASIVFTVLSLLLAQRPGGVPAPQNPPTDAAKPPAEPAKPLVDEKPVVTKHEIRVNGKTLSYTATTGLMPIKGPQGEIEANIFYVAYTLDGVSDLTKRPLM